MNMYEHRRERLLALIEDHYGGDRKRFCDVTEMSESRLAQLLSPTYRQGLGFGEKAARALEDRLHLDALYFDLLAIGEKFSRRSYPRGAAAGEEFSVDTIPVPHVSLSLKAGSVHVKLEELRPSGPILHLPKMWLEPRNLSPDALIAITISGAGMSPRLQDGDIAVVNMADTELKDGKVFLINYRGQAVIKRISHDFGRWYMNSDNSGRKQYAREEFSKAHCVIIGKVIVLVSEQV